MNQPNGSTDASSPIDYPKITIEGQTYRLKFGMGAMFRLEKWGVDPRRLKELYEADEGRLQLSFKMLAACLGHELPGGRWKTAGFDPESLADMVPTEQASEIGRVVIEALLKARPEGETTAQTLPATPAAPLPTQ